MTPERVAGLVARWVRFYTRDLPASVARRRVEEIEADLHDHIAHERADGADDRGIARGIASRMLRGMAADAAWRRRQVKGTAPNRPLVRSILRVALGVALVLSLPLVGMLVSDAVVWSPADFVLAGVLLAIVGVALELAVRRAGGRPAAVAIAALGVSAALLGEADDAPGLVLLGLVLVAGSVVLGVRTAQRSG